jgi:hypothetical protein
MPTGAQIMAAAAEMERCMFAAHELPLPMDLHLKYLHTAERALIAAEMIEKSEISNPLGLRKLVLEK